MIELYGVGATDFSKNGITLRPQEATVTYQENGQYDLELLFPVSDDLPEIEYGQVIRCTVPRQVIDTISLGLASYWTVSDANGATLYSKVPGTKGVSYKQWNANTAANNGYTVGSKVTYDRKNYRCTQWSDTAGDRLVPPSASSWWTQISGTTSTPGKVAADLEYGAIVIRTGDFNSRYMEAADTAGHAGYIEISKCTDSGETEERTVQGWTITEQCFVVTDIVKEDRSGKKIRITCDHVSYQLGRTMLGDCNLTEVNPATALMLIRGAMQETYPGVTETNITDRTITQDYSWKNAQAAILDPKSGVLQASGGMIIRDNWDVYLLEEGEENPKYSVRYGANMKSVKWTGSVDSLVTRVYPVAKSEDGETLMLPEKYIDTVRDVPFIRPEVLDTKLKVGDKIEGSDGTETELTEDEVLSRMRDAAAARFSDDKCDQPEVKLELDWIHMPETEEYKEYAALDNAAPGEWVAVTSGPLGISVNIRMTGYTWDPILCRYKSTTFGDIKVKSTVAGYSLQSGAVTNRALASGAVRGENIQANSLTAREIEAGSITADEIASRSIVTELLAANAVTADEIAANSITSEKIQAYAITAAKIAADAITSDKILAGSITAVKIAADAVTADKIQAGSVTADKIGAGAVTAEKVAANAITANKIDAGAVTTEKLAAGSVTANKISTTDLAAIQATLQIASIASATIQSADIGYAQIKDLNAQSAYFGQAIFDEAVGGKLYVPRLAVGYAAMIGATVGDLVIQASNGNYYALDVGLDGNVTATQRTVTSAEITAGHTNDGRTLVLGTDIVAEDLNTSNIYAGHALMDEIIAQTIDVDQLWAREAFINALMVQDISSNTYIRSTIGTWDSGSTITQTINSLNSRISELGYGTVYMQPDEPDHSHLTSGDIWVQTMPEGTWQSVYNEWNSWTEIYNNVDAWQTLGSVPIMWVWDGQGWQLMYDAQLPTTLQTEIEQLSDAIALRATKAEVNLLSGQVSTFSAKLTVQAEEIRSAVEAVNTKASVYVMWADPRTAYTVTLGDQWVKRDERLATWQTVYDGYDSWTELYNTHDHWQDSLGDRTYVWTGSQWIETSDRAEEIYQRTLIDQTSTQISLLAETTATIQGEQYSLRSQLTVANDRISAEVERATTAEGGKISKTSRLQTADAIVSEAVTQANSAASGAYIAKTTIYQDAESIKTEAVRESASAASGSYIAKTSTYQTADAIMTEAVRQAGTNANNNYLKKTNTYQTADAIVNEAVSASESSAAQLYLAKSGNYTDVDAILTEAQNKADAAATTAKNASIAKTSSYQSAQAIVNAAVASATTAAGQAYIAKTSSYQTADAIVGAAETYVDGELENYSTTEQTATAISSYVTDNAYGKVSGITIQSAGIDISASQYVHIDSGGNFRVTTGNFGIKSDAGANEYVLWSNDPNDNTKYFRVKRDGTVYLTKLIAVSESGSETTINLRTAGLWKLNYHTVKNYSTNSITLSNGDVVNFIKASDINISAGLELGADGKSYNYWGIASGAISKTGTHVNTGQVIYDNGVSAGYKQGWNECRQQMIDNLGGNYYWNAGTYYSQLFVAPSVGAKAVNDCRAAQTRYAVPAAKT